MTLYGVDISNNNDGGRNTLNLAEIVAEGYSWIEAKVSEGNYYGDPDWARTRDWCRANNVPVVGYHYVRGDCSPESQADLYVRMGGGSTAMLDHEANSGNISQFWAVVRAFNARGVEIVLSYIPHWYWEEIGSPDLSQVPGLVASNYVNGSGYGSVLYPGDNSDRWFAYGGCQPVILQFTDKASVAGTRLDCNAFRGTPDQLRALLSGGAAAPTPPVPPNTGGVITVADANSIANLLGGNDVGGNPLLGPDGADYRRVDLLADYTNPGEYGQDNATPEGPNTARSLFDESTTLAKILTRRYTNKHGQKLDAFDLLVALYRHISEPKV